MLNMTNCFYEGRPALMNRRRYYAAALSALIAASLCSCGELGEPNNRIARLSAPVTGITTTTRTGTAAPVKAETVTGEITTIRTDAKCRSIEFDDGYILFVDKDGKYTIMNSDKKAVKSLTLTDDSGERITVFSMKDGTIVCKKGDSPINEFTYKGNRISVKDGVVYFSGTKVEYYDTSFSSLKLTDDIAIECISTNKFVVKKDGKKTDEPVDITDDNGVTYKLEAVDEGVEITNSNDELMLSIVVTGRYIDVANGHVIVNGQTMKPPGSSDITTLTTTTTTTAKKEEEEEETTTTTKQTVVVTQPVYYYYENWEDEEISNEPSQPVVTESPMANNKNVNISSETSELLGMINEVRRQYGLSELYGLQLLDEAAYRRAKEVSEVFFRDDGDLSHSRPDGRGCETIVDEVGLPDWTAYCENLAYGMNTKSTVKEAFDSWMNSEGHRANILNDRVKYVAVACYHVNVDGDDYYFWDQFFYNDTF